VIKRFRVTWQFAHGYEMVRTSYVLARDRKHAQERVWQLHVETTGLRNKIEFFAIDEVEEVS
jgi:hypothetical protein